MLKFKENIKHHVLSIRVTDDEKAVLNEITRHTRKNISTLIREAVSAYTSRMEVGDHRG